MVTVIQQWRSRYCREHRDEASLIYLHTRQMKLEQQRTDQQRCGNWYNPPWILVHFWFFFLLRFRLLSTHRRQNVAKTVGSLRSFNDRTLNKKCLLLLRSLSFLHFFVVTKPDNKAHVMEYELSTLNCDELRYTSRRDKSSRCEIVISNIPQRYVLYWRPFPFLKSDQKWGTHFLSCVCCFVCYFVVIICPKLAHC